MAHSTRTRQDGSAAEIYTSGPLSFGAETRPAPNTHFPRPAPRVASVDLQDLVFLRSRGRPSARRPRRAPLVVLRSFSSPVSFPFISFASLSAAGAYSRSPPSWPETRHSAPGRPASLSSIVCLPHQSRLAFNRGRKDARQKQQQLYVALARHRAEPRIARHCARIA